MNRKEYLQIAEQTICKDRQDTHGNPENTFGLIAEYWSVYLSKLTNKETHMNADDVAAMMVLFKMARFQTNKAHEDNVVDGVGYFALAGELRGQIEGDEK